MQEYKKEHIEKIISTPGGHLCQVYGALENAKCSIALVDMEHESQGVKHYHDNITEIYLFAKGTGKIVINENENQINEGDIYIIPKENVHFIKADTNMEFACICTPPWEEKHEFVVEMAKSKNKFNKIEVNGVIQKLSDKEENCVKIIEIEKEFVPNQAMKKYSRVYYFLKGNGRIETDSDVVKVEPGMCYKFDFENEKIITDNKLEFALICELNIF